MICSYGVSLVDFYTVNAQKTTFSGTDARSRKKIVQGKIF
jgi:hypothetical protein